MKRIAVFPGSFDPITLGHVDIIKRAIPLFDEIIIAIGVNAVKKYHWSLDERFEFIEKSFEAHSNIKVKTFKGLTANFCKAEGARYIIRGLRNATDFTYEQTIAQANDKVNGVDSVFLMCSPEYSHISSSVVRDIIQNGGIIDSMVPKGVISKS